MIPEGFTEVFERGTVPANMGSKDAGRRGTVSPSWRINSSEDANEQAELLAAKEIFDRSGCAEEPESSRRSVLICL